VLRFLGFLFCSFFLPSKLPNTFTWTGVHDCAWSKVFFKKCLFFVSLSKGDLQTSCVDPHEAMRVRACKCFTALCYSLLSRYDFFGPNVPNGRGTNRACTLSRHNDRHFCSKTRLVCANKKISLHTHQHYGDWQGMQLACLISAECMPCYHQEADHDDTYLDT
jgi:hypothetical protein